MIHLFCVLCIFRAQIYIFFFISPSIFTKNPASRIPVTRARNKTIRKKTLPQLLPLGRGGDWRQEAGGTNQTDQFFERFEKICKISVTK